MIIRFVKGTKLGSLFIEWQEKTAMPFTPSHVEALTPDGFYLGAHIGSGIKKRQVGYDKDIMSTELLLTLDATPEQDKKFYEFLATKIGEPYDWRAILGFVLPHHEHIQDHAICSAYMTLALRECGWFPFKLAAPAHLISPRDLLLLISAKMQIPY